MSVRRAWAGAAVAAALAAIVLAPSGRDAAGLASFRASGTGLQAARLAKVEWWGGQTAAGSGEPVTVYVSTSYPQDETVARGWADFFAGLVHGDELTRVSVYVAAPAEVGSLGGEDALGCYGSGRLVVPGDAGSGIDPHVVAAHEYGHHVAASRDNAPWRAGEWGTKRWASYVGVCSRTRAGTAFPGDEGRRYELNPGEGFAEAYRVLNETRTGAAPFGWTLVDASFAPDATALAAIEADVLQPWRSGAATTLAGLFAARGPRVWQRTIATPLDGDLDVRVRLPRAAAYELDLLGGGTVLARGLWSGTAEKSLGYTICGERSLVLRVTRRGPAGSIRAEVRRP